MNQDNYASLEASKRLLSAGIVLETDQQWYVLKNGDCYLSGDSIPMIEIAEEYPVPSMAEAWRELPKGTLIRQFVPQTFVWIDDEDQSTQHSTNPTDALIDLLIYIKGVDTPK